MKTTIKTSESTNLFYHLLSHLCIDHPSNIYDKNYVNDYRTYKNTQKSGYDLMATFSCKSEIYQERFNELAALNFIPFHFDDVEMACNSLKGYSLGLSEQSRSFIDDFIVLAVNEKGDYSKWHYGVGDKFHNSLNETLNSHNNPLGIMQKVLNRDTDIYLIDSLFNYGRAFVEESKFIVGVINPRCEKEVNQAVMIVLHEMIHCITDSLVKEDVEVLGITLKERLVMVFEYLYIKEFYDEWLEAYSEMLTEWHSDIDIHNIISKFDISKKLVNELNAFIDRMKALS